ncbi:MAG: glycosyltransferase family 4 protein [Bacteroidia bacterium]
MKKILFITSHRRNRSPGQRFRFEQYYEYLEQNGFKCDVSYIISANDDIYLYRKGKYFKKFIIVLKSIWKRFKDLKRANDYDIIFIYREALLIGSTFFERRFRKTEAKLVFDFDDSVWLYDTSEANKRFEWLKNPGKTARLIELSDMVFAGNQYLADYALQYNGNVKIVPTTIDTEEYKRDTSVKKEDSICIGWTGSITTIKHFEFAAPILRILKEKYGNRISIKVIGDRNYVHKGLGIQGLPWNKENEIKELSTFDIGIMPLPNDKWSKGKCGLKGLQYMALEIPAIMSPVGVNSDIIQDGVNGFLADTPEEWIDKMSRLIEDKFLREKIGKEARKTVIEKYSKEAQKGNYLKYFNEILAR